MNTSKTYPTFTDPNGVLQAFKGVTDGRHGKRIVAFIRNEGRYWKNKGEPVAINEWVHFGNAVHVDAMDKRVRRYRVSPWRVRYCPIDMENQLTLKEIETINQTTNQ
jgi:hypothetical protein